MTASIPRLRVSRRTRAVALAAVFSFATFFVSLAPTDAPIPRPEALVPKPVAALGCASEPSFTGRITNTAQTTAAATKSTTGNVYAYISDVVAAWSCTAYYRYSGVAWAREDAELDGNFDWGAIINSTSVPCNWTVGETNYLKANDTTDCADSDAEYAMQVSLEHFTGDMLEDHWHADTSPDEPGDFMYVHSDCTSYYEGSGMSGERMRWNVPFTSTEVLNRPGDNCDPRVIDSTGTTQTIVVDGTKPVLAVTTPAAAAYPNSTATYNVVHTVTEAVAGFSGANDWELQRQISSVTAPNTCGSWFNDFATGNLTTGTTTGSITTPQTLNAATCYRWKADATDLNGNVATQVISPTVLIDTVAPTTTFTAPVAGTTTVLNGTSTSVTWTETEAHSGVLTRSLQRRVATYSGGACGSYANDGSPVTTASPLAVSSLVDGKCYQWIQTLTDRATNSTATTSGTIRIDVGSPSANFSTPDEGTTVITNATSYDVAWTETAGSGSITSRSLQRERVLVGSTPSVCPTSGWASDGTAYTGTSPRNENPPLVTGYCYRWVQTLTNSLPKTAASTSGSVLVDTSAPTGSVNAPAANLPLSGAVTITGTAADPESFKEYQLEYGAGASPGSWTSIGIFTIPQPTTATLATWAPGALSGVYTIRLTVRQHAGTSTSVTTRTVVLENAGLGEERFLTRVPFDLGGGWAVDVGVHNGEARLSRELFSIPSYGPPQALGLSYSSLESGAAGLFGTGWSSNLTQYLSFDATDIVVWHRADGGRVPFGKVSGTWTSLAGHFETLSLAGSEYTITQKDQTKLVFESTGAGRLKRAENRFTKALTLVWNTSSATATDASGRVTNVVIDSANNRITSVTDSANRAWSFGYTGAALTSVTDPASKVTTLGYTSSLLTTVTRSRSRVSGSPETITWTIGYTSGKATAVTDPVAATTASTFTYNPGSTDVGLLRDDSPLVRDTWIYAYDDRGRVTAMTDPLSTGPTNHVTTTTWDAASNPTAVAVPIDEGSAQSTTTNTYDAAGNLLTEVVPIDASIGVTTVYTYNATNDLLTRTDADDDSAVRTVTKYTFDGSGHLTSVNVNCTTSGTTPPTQGQGGTCTGAGTQDAATNLITNYAYTTNDQLASEQDSLGRVTKLGYDTYGNETSLTQNCTSSGTTPPSPFDSCTGGGTADAQTNVVSTATFDQATTAGKAGLATKTTDPIGRDTTYTYDALGRQLTEVLPGDATILALTRTITYDELDNVLTDVESWTGATRTTSHVYDLANRETQATDPTGVVATTAHDLAGNVTSSTAGGVTTTSEYDGLGQLLIETSPDGYTGRAYDARGNEIQIASGAGDVTERVFTRTGSVTRETSDPLGLELKTDHTYDRLGRELTVTDPYVGGTPGDTTTMTYDRAGRQFTRQVTGGPVVTTTYDRIGNAVAVLGSDGKMAASLVDPLDRVVTSIFNCTNSGTTVPSAGSTCAGTGTADATTNITTQTYYDKAGATIAVKDPKGITTRSILNVRSLVSESIANCTDTGTTPTSNPAACVGGGTANDNTNVRSTSTYDGSGATLSTISAVGTGESATTYAAYDGAGRSLGTKDPRGTVSTIQYDTYGRVVSTVGNCTEDTSSPQPPSGDWWTCNGSTLNDGTWNVKTTYGYDAAGNQSSVVAPNGRETRTSYDADGRVTQRIDNYVDGVAGATDDLPTDYFYDDAGRQTGILAPTASGTTRTATRFIYNADGTLASENRNCTTTGTTVPSNAGDCTGAGTANAETNVTTSYQYDSRGNRTRLIAPDPSATTGTGTVTTQYAFDSADRLCRVVENATGSTNLQTLTNPCSDATQTGGTATTNVSTRYPYDPAGNLASMIDAKGNTTTYGYDATGQMTSLTDARGETLVWVYDALGHKTRQENRSDPPFSASLQWTYDGAGRVASRIADASGGPADTTAPSIPTALDAVANGSSRIDLTWNGSTDAVGVTRYTIKRDGNPIADVSALATSFSDRSVAASTAYSYTVTASDAAGNTSAASTSDAATTASGPTIYAADPYTRTTSGWGTPPTGGAWTDQNTTDITTTGSVGRQSVPSQTTRWTRLGSLSVADQEGLVRMKVSSLTGTGSVAYARIETRADSTYDNYYRFQLQFAASGAVDVVIRKLVAGSITTLRSDASVITGFTTADWVWLRWKVTNSGSDVALTYKLWKDGTSEPGSFATTYTDVAPGATYTGAGRFMLTSQALSGFSGTYPYVIEYDDLSIATVGATADTTAPTVPTNLVASPAGAKQIDLTWTASTDAVGIHAYKVYRGGTYLATTGSPSWSDAGLTAETFYSYTVSALDGAGNESAQTGSASLTSTPAGATTYTYDANGNRLTAASGAQTVTMTYDRLNRVLTVDDPDLGTGADTTYTYNLTSPAWTDPSGAYTATLDKFDRPTAVNDPVNTSDFTWTYRADGQPASFGQPDGNTTAHVYDAVGRLTSKDTTAAGPVNRALYDWTYNRAGRILTEAETVTGGASNGTVAYGYDAVGRLSTSALSGTTTTYGWEAVANRSSVQVGGGSTATTAYDVANRPTSGTNPSASYTNNDDGQLTARPNQTLEWDHLGRLTAVKDAAGTTTLARYTYDPLDRVVVVEHPGVDRTRFRYTGATTSVAQWLDDIAGTVTRSVANSWTGERLQDWTGSGSNLRVYGTNAHHDTTWLASNTGAVSQSLRYDPWGTARTTVPSGYAPFRLQGSWHDATTDLAWVITRWYAPSLGRFVSEDSLLGQPIDPPSRHLYAYGQSDPVGRWDPDGRKPESQFKLYDRILGFITDEMRTNSRGDAFGRWARLDPLNIFALQQGVINNLVVLLQFGLLEQGIVHAHDLCLPYWAATWPIHHLPNPCLGKHEPGRWDHKPRLRAMAGLNPFANVQFWTPIRGTGRKERIRYDIWSNIHYGYVGRSHGIPRGILRLAAEAFGGQNHPADRLSVNLGILLWDRHKFNLARRNVQNVIVSRMHRFRAMPGVVKSGWW